MLSRTSLLRWALRFASLWVPALLCFALRPANAARLGQSDESGQPQLSAAQLCKGKTIQEIELQGNRRVESGAILQELVSEAKGVCQPSTIAADIRALWALGFFSDIEVQGEPAPGGIKLIYKIVERPTVRKVVVEGHDRIKIDDINEVLDIERNEVLDLGKIAQNVAKVRSLYAENGFFLATIDYGVREIPKQPGRVDVVFTVSESDEVTVREVIFVGNRAVSDKELQQNIFTRPGSFFSVLSKQAGGVFNRDYFAQDYALLRQYYADQGYHDADFQDAELSLSPDRRYVHVRIPVKEGKRYSIGSLGASETLEGEQSEALFSKKDLEDTMAPILRKGDIASAAKINEVREALELQYKDVGYAYVNVILDARPDKKKQEYHVHFDVQKGPLVYIEKVDINGNAKTADKVIRREIPIFEGDVYSESAKERTRMRVMRLGYFSEVNVSTSRGSADNKIVLNVEVTEQLTGSFQVGAGYSAVESFVFNAQISYNNFLGRGASVRLNAERSSNRTQFSFNYYTRYFMDSNWSFILNLFHMQLGNYGYARGSTGGEVSFGYPLSSARNVTLFAGYNLQKIDISFGSRAGGGIGGFGGLGGVNPLVAAIGDRALVRNLYRGGLTSSAILRLNIEGRDSMLFPTRGYYQDFRVEIASPYLGSQNIFNRYASDTRFYVPVVPTEKAFRAWVVFKTRLQLGWIHNRRRDGVPIAERYTPGSIYGHGGLRGFPARQLGPRLLVNSDPDPKGRPIAHPIGGNLLTALNLELESMLVPQANIKALVFMDVGNAFNTERLLCDVPNPDQLPKADPCAPWSLRNLRYSAGFGVRWRSPIGPLRFEWGFPLDRITGTELLPEEQRMMFEFNVGTGF